MSKLNDPELPFVEGSEIEAVVDVSIHGLDNVFRPILINQDSEILQLTLADAKRLHHFLGEAVEFVEEFSKRKLQ